MKKNLFYLSALFALSVGLVSCSDDAPKNPYSNDNNDEIGYDVILRNDTSSKLTSVDLGLSVNWASANLGAESKWVVYKFNIKKENGLIEHFVDSVYYPSYITGGDYFAWGEIEPKTTYSSDNYSYHNVNIGNDISGTEYDAATQSVGNGWRMPTKAEFQELLDNCIWNWLGDGIAVIGKTNTSPIVKDIALKIINDSTKIHTIVYKEKDGEVQPIDTIYAEKVVNDTIWTNKRPAIFIPLGGNRWNTSIYNEDKYAGYWSSTAFEDWDAWSMGFTKDYHTIKAEGYRRFVGRMIRPVKDK